MSKQMQKFPRNRLRFVNKMQNTTFFYNEIFVILENLSYICDVKQKNKVMEEITENIMKYDKI